MLQYFRENMATETVTRARTDPGHKWHFVTEIRSVNSKL